MENTKPIDDYLNGTMSPDERAQFEQRVAESPELAQEVEFQAAFRAAIAARARAKSAVAATEKALEDDGFFTPRQKPNRGNGMLALVLAALLGIALWVRIKSEETPAAAPSPAQTAPTLAPTPPPPVAAAPGPADSLLLADIGDRENNFLVKADASAPAWKALFLQKNYTASADSLASLLAGQSREDLLVRRPVECFFLGAMQAAGFGRAPARASFFLEINCASGRQKRADIAPQLLARSLAQQGDEAAALDALRRFFDRLPDNSGPDLLGPQLRARLAARLARLPADEQARFSPVLRTWLEQ